MLHTFSGTASLNLATGTFDFDAAASARGILEETRHLRDILRAKNHKNFTR